MDKSMTSTDVRDIIDWDYYITRLSTTILKIVVIPGKKYNEKHKKKKRKRQEELKVKLCDLLAALQKVSNPVPRVAYPDWLRKRIAEKNNPLKQRHITDLFAAQPVREEKTAGREEKK